ncbi:MAG: DNA alkylation repair protein, partial [Burkholderiales bacterium]
MAEPLKNRFGAEIPRMLAKQISREYPAFRGTAFIEQIAEGYEPLDLMARARKIARALRDHLPADYPQAIEILLLSLGPKAEKIEGQGMAPFFYLPHTFFVAEFGLDFFEASMRAQ